uniref:Uncharacterized protein LOC104235804 n=1 Tax=Nicotiana sylvestris TaxID=4096 RepID=A0A1U7XN64_NICSY|nr:PREDICTED: uncharacterized protein LOC104235804 [Nicotiana sylvestris]
MAILPSLLPPSTVKQASKDPKWRLAMQEEFDALLKYKTWDLIPPDPKHNIVDNKWISHIKQKFDGSIDRYKALLFAKGFTQHPGVDFHSTFSPVIKPTTIRIVLSLATCFAWPLHQLDVNNAFLQGHLKQPKGFEHPDYQNHICRLQKAIYGLKQDLGLLHYFLGVEVLPNANGLILSQSNYISDVLKDFSMEESKGVHFPLSTSTQLKLDDGYPLIDAKHYRSAIGKLQYLAFTRPDISYVVNKLSQFMHRPTIIHWTAVKRVLRYLKQTITHGLFFKKQSNHALHIYSDADWAGDLTD